MGEGGMVGWLEVLVDAEILAFADHLAAADRAERFKVEFQRKTP